MIIRQVKTILFEEEKPEETYTAENETHYRSVTIVIIEGNSKKHRKIQYRNCKKLTVIVKKVLCRIIT